MIAKIRKLQFILSLSVVLVLFPALVQADVVPTLQSLQIVDRGNHLVLNWSFYYAEFPAHFQLKEKQGKEISLQDAETLYQNITDIVLVAFELRINGQLIQPEKISSLTLAPNKLCTVKLIYPGQPGGHLEVRAPVLQYLPPTYVINYDVFDLGLTGKAVTGDLALQPGAFSQVIHYNEVAKGQDWSLPLEDSVGLGLFKLQLRTVWINSNWLLIAVILLLVQSPRRVLFLFSATTLLWLLLCLGRGIADRYVAWSIPIFLPAVATMLVGGVAAKFPGKYRWLTLMTLSAGLLNACYDLQQIRWTAEDHAGGALLGICLGYAASVGLMLLLLIPLVAEVKKNREFTRRWAPGLCWLVAAFAIVSPIQKWLFR